MCFVALFRNDNDWRVIIYFGRWEAIFNSGFATPTMISFRQVRLLSLK